MGSLESEFGAVLAAAVSAVAEFALTIWLGSCFAAFVVIAMDVQTGVCDLLGGVGLDVVLDVTVNVERCTGFAVSFRGVQDFCEGLGGE